MGLDTFSVSVSQTLAGTANSYKIWQDNSTTAGEEICLFAWCLTALSAQTGYIVPQQ